MSIFKDEVETKRVIFNVRLDLAQRLDSAKEDARKLGKKLDVDTVVDKALEKFLRKAEKKLSEMKPGDGEFPLAESSDDIPLPSEEVDELPAEENYPGLRKI